MKLPFRKIRDRTLALVILASLLPVLLLAVFVGARLRTELTDQALRAQEEVAGAIRQGMFVQFKSYQGQLERLAAEPLVQGMEPEAQRRTLFAFLDRNPLFFSAFIYRDDGVVSCLAYRNRFNGDDGLVGKNLRKVESPKYRPLIEAFDRVCRTGRLEVSEMLSTLRRKSQLIILVPIKAFTDPERTVGVLSVGLYIDGVTLQEMVGSFGDEKGFLVLTDGRGNVLARKGRMLPPGLLRMTMSHSPDGLRFESTRSSLEGREYIVTIGAIPVVGGFIVAGQPRDAVLGFVGQVLWGMALLTLIAVIISALFGLVLANDLVAPILGLVEGIRRVAAGVVSHRIGREAEGEDELAEACRAFNEMAGTLEKNRLIDEIWSRTWKPPS